MIFSLKDNFRKLKPTRKKIGYLIVVICVTLFVLLLANILWLREGRVLSSDMVPTAESLIQNPIQRPAFVDDIRPAPSTALSLGQEICMNVYPGELMKSGDSYDELEQSVAKNTHFFINNRPLPFYTPAVIEYPAGLREIVEDQETGTILFCFVPDLEKGIHIVEVKTSDLAGAEYSYRWAVYVK